MIENGKSIMPGGAMSTLSEWTYWCQKKEVPGGREGKEIDKIEGKAGQHIEKVSEKIKNEQMQKETLTMIAIIGENWAGVMRLFRP